MGVADHTLLKQRRAASAMTCVRNCGADLDLSLVLSDDRTRGGSDPAFAAHVSVLHLWATAVWERWAPLAIADRVMKKTMTRLQCARRVWSVVYGPTAATVATAQRLGWQVESAAILVTDDGTRLNLMIDSPAYVKGVVQDSASRWRWRRIEERLPALASQGLGLGAWWKPIASVLNSPYSDSWGPKQKGALRSAIAGRQWPQQRLHRAGLVELAYCQLCKDAQQGPAIGTLMHRLHCPALAQFCTEFMPTWMRGFVHHFGPGCSPTVHTAITRGLCRAPLLPHRPQELYGTFWWHIAPEGSPIGGQIFTDGSLLDGELGKAGVALGWAFIMLDSGNNVVAAAHGVPPRWVDTIQGAELYAIQMVLACSAFPDVIFTDCKTVQQGVYKAGTWAASAKRRYSRIWTAVHAAFDGAVADGMVVWMPAHTSEGDIDKAVCSNGQRLTGAWRSANELADQLAKMAAETVRVQGPSGNPHCCGQGIQTGKGHCHVCRQAHCGSRGLRQP